MSPTTFPPRLRHGAPIACALVALLCTQVTTAQDAPDTQAPDSPSAAAPDIRDAAGTISEDDTAAPEAGDTAATETPTAPTPESQPPATAQELRHAIDALVVDERWSDAVVAARQLVELTEKQSGPNALAIAEPLTRLGELQSHARDFKGAEASYTRAIGIIEAHVGPLNGRLIDPLRGLGFAYAAERDHASATAVLSRGVLTARRNQGLFDPRQIDMLEQLAESQTQIGAIEDAKQSLMYLVSVAEKAFGRDDPRTVHAISLLARWYSRIAAYDIARNFYTQAIERVEEARGPEDTTLVEPLRGIAENAMLAFVIGDPSQRKADEMAAESLMMPPQPNYADPWPGNRRNLTSVAEEALERAVAILEKSVAAGNGDVLELARTLIQAGDWYMAKGEIATAHDRYRRAWAATHGDDDKLIPIAERSPDHDRLAFKDPVLIFIPLGSTARLYQDRAPEDVVEQRVIAQFVVTADGSVRDAKIIDSEAGRRKTNLTLSALDDAVYRPRLEAGLAVDASGVLYKQVYRTLPPR